MSNENCCPINIDDLEPSIQLDYPICGEEGPIASIEFNVSLKVFVIAYILSKLEECCDNNNSKIAKKTE